MRIAIIIDHPTKDDLNEGIPLSGLAGRMFLTALGRHGVLRTDCLVGYAGSPDLSARLDASHPNVCLLLGAAALAAASESVRKLDNWRGSLFLGDRPPFVGRKCIATYAPQECFAAYEKLPLIVFDLAKAVAEADAPELVLPKRTLIVPTSFEDLIHEMDKVLINKPTIAIDIEGYVNAMTCISIATSKDYCFIVPLAKRDHSHYWDDEAQEIEIWRRLSAILASYEIPKILQNSLYDRFVMQYSYGMMVNNVVHDTMLQHWELYCELEKGLGFQASLHTKEPYYKGDRKSDDLDTYFLYCCKDSAITHEISSKLDGYLIGEQRAHYLFNMAMLNILLYMEMRGIKYDNNLAAQRLQQVHNHLYAYQYRLDTLAGCGFDYSQPVLPQVQAAICHKRKPEVPKKDYVEVYKNVQALLAQPLDDIAKGYINLSCEKSMNTKSPMFKELLYEKLKLPKQIKKDPKTGKAHLATDYEALLKIQKKSPHQAVELAMEIGELRTRSQMLGIYADDDRRIRCGYNIVGTETGRLTCYTSPTGSGYNLQTIPSDSSLRPKDHPLHQGMRDLFVADDGCFIFQCDLSGADGWTVAAHCASLGDPTMLEDYQAGIKPAKVLCYLLRHGAHSLARKSREEILALTKSISSKDWDYFACKIGQHGSCYLMGAQRLSNAIFIQSEGKVTLSAKECEDLQNLFFVRYRVKTWHDWMKRNLDQCLSDPKRKHPMLGSAGGFRRRFYGRYTEILGQALAHEPQANTTYATNVAAFQLWNDPENRNADGSLRIEPLHQVHDALVGQFRIEAADWAVGKIKSYFDNEITIAGIPIVIPFEGNYGTSWGKLEYSI